MLGDASSGFIAAGYQYPFTFLLAGLSFLLLLLLEYLANEIDTHSKNSRNFAIKVSQSLNFWAFGFYYFYFMGNSSNILRAISPMM